MDLTLALLLSRLNGLKGSTKAASRYGEHLTVANLVLSNTTMTVEDTYYIPRIRPNASLIPNVYQVNSAHDTWSVACPTSLYCA